jgi:hypothetical protein
VRAVRASQGCVRGGDATPARCDSCCSSGPHAKSIRWYCVHLLPVIIKYAHCSVYIYGASYTTHNHIMYDALIIHTQVSISRSRLTVWPSQSRSGSSCSTSRQRSTARSQGSSNRLWQQWLAGRTDSFTSTAVNHTRWVSERFPWV